MLSKTPNADGTWGIQIGGVGEASVSSQQPLRIDSYVRGIPTIFTAGYASLEAIDGGLQGRGSISPWPGVTFRVTDTWSVLANTAVTTQRALTVSGSQPSAEFMDALVMDSATTAPRSAVDYFVPGLIYGSTANVKPDCIGGADTYDAGYSGVVHIREDRLPAPLFGLHFGDGSSVTLLDLSPSAGTIEADGTAAGSAEVCDEGLGFGALGAEQTSSPTSGIKLGYWFPGSEGEVSYDPVSAGQQILGEGDQGDHAWQLRLHPVRDGLSHGYALTWRFSAHEDFTTYQKNAWRYAWNALYVSENVVIQDIDLVRRTLTDFVADRVDTEGSNSALLSAIDVETGDVLFGGIDRLAYLGFIGKNLENAEYLLREAQRRHPVDAAHLRAAADAIIGTFLAIDEAPPTAEGLLMNDGTPAFYPTQNVCYLRPFSDDFNALLRAYQFELANGRRHPTWLAHVKAFADWLLTQQGADGSFPRAWNAGTGTVYDASKNMTGLAVPLLLRLGAISGDPSYELAALQAGEASWQIYLDNDHHFVGATPDRPDVLVHEAAGLALDSYADLYQVTEDPQWLERAIAAADANETWVMLWNVPPPADATDAELSVKSGVSTVGMDLCTSTNSGSDYYDANDVDSYAKLFAWTGDVHYLEVARLLMHNTKGMLALPGRTFDLVGPGMQQEFWYLAPPRRQSWVREYTPWVTATQLRGIFLTEEFDPALYAQIIGY